MSGGQLTFASNTTLRATAAAAPAGGGARGAPSGGSGSSPGSAGGGGSSEGDSPGEARAGSVDVFGWAVLDKMRGETNVCYDWCQEAMEQLGVSPKSHRHYVCFPLYRPDQPGAGAPAVCDNACPSNGECPNSCPSDGPYRDLPGVSQGSAAGGARRVGAGMVANATLLQPRR
jgi:hypothetical protein